jgi:hypothetical protein
MKRFKDVGENTHIAVKARRQCDALRLPYLWATYNTSYAIRNGKRYESSRGKLAHAARWRKFVETQLPELERQLTEWEDAHPEQFKALPWYESRMAYREAKARGEVETPVWWEVMGAVKSYKNGTGVTKAMRGKRKD